MSVFCVCETQIFFIASGTYLFTIGSLVVIKNFFLPFKLAEKSHGTDNYFPVFSIFIELNRISLKTVHKYSVIVTIKHYGEQINKKVLEKSIL